MPAPHAPAAIPVIHAITDDHTVARPDFLAEAAAVMEALGARGAVHLRAPALPARALFAHARRLARVQALSGCALVVSDRVDVAMAAGARGVQLTSRSMLVGDATRIAGALWVGASVHDVAAAVAAQAAGAHWVVAGHVFATASHPGAPGRGRGFLAAVSAAVRVPTVAIGGITPERVRAVRREGARGIAAIRGIWGAPRAGEAAARYLWAYDADE